MGFLDVIKGNILKRPGDNASARVTPTGRKVVKIDTQDIKYSATKYSTGTIVETKTTRMKNK